MLTKVALITPSHRGDLERFALLSDSIDCYLGSYGRHYVIVNDEDLPLFKQFASDNRVVLSCSQFLPNWLRLAPSFLVRRGRRIWWSLRFKPVHGWHIQQIIKISAVLQLPEERFGLIDSDVVFVRAFDVNAYGAQDLTPLYYDPAAISADAPLHAVWTRSCDHLLGQPEPTKFPADDYIGNVIFWDKSAVRDMTATIEQASSRNWVHALCSTRDFSEYLLYGHFVQNSPRHKSTHKITTESLATSYWGDARLDNAEVTALVEMTSEAKVALCIQSFSRTPVETIREVVGLPRSYSQAPHR
jgi:hypothetical protein